jgi:hypothetical protein
MAHLPRKHVDFNYFITVIITADFFPRTNPDELQIIPTLCRTLLSDLHLIQPAIQ